MLRSLKHPHLRPELMGFQVTTVVTPSITVNIGAGDLSASARNAAGKATLTLKEPIIRAGCVIGSVGASVADGGFFTYDTDPSSTAVVGEALDAAGSGDDGTFYMLSCAWKSANTDRVTPSQQVLNTARSPRLMGFHISSAGAITSGGTQLSAAATKASSIYTMTFRNAFGRSCIPITTPISTSQKATRITAASASAVSVATFSSAEAAEDNAFQMLVLGWDAKDEQYGMGRCVQVPQIDNRFESLTVNGTGTAAITIGTTDATLTDNGTGDYTLTFTKAFARAPIVIPSGKATRAQLHSTPTSTACRILCFNGAGVATDDSFSVMILGYDNSVEI